MQHVLNYFNDFSERQLTQLQQLESLYKTWNEKINVISRKDIDNLYIHHVLHSLAISKLIRFAPGSHVLDFGTGGGFPGIPLAIAFPEVQFKLIDRTAKKIKVVQSIAQEIGLQNVVACQLSGEEEKEKFDFVVSRAVMRLDDLIRIIRKNISYKQSNALPNGLICLKGGDLTTEINSEKKHLMITPLDNWFKEEWFKGKQLLYLPI